MLSRPLVDVVTHLDIQSINVAASMSTEFDLKLCVKQNSSDILNVNCHFVAVTCIGRKPTHYLITFEVISNNLTITDHTSNSDATNQLQQIVLSTQQSQQTLSSSTTSSMPKPNTEPRGSLHGSIRRGIV